jgi:hypothetical protein
VYNPIRTTQPAHSPDQSGRDYERRMISTIGARRSGACRYSGGCLQGRGRKVVFLPLPKRLPTTPTPSFAQKRRRGGQANGKWRRRMEYTCGSWSSSDNAGQVDVVPPSKMSHRTIVCSSSPHNDHTRDRPSSGIEYSCAHSGRRKRWTQGGTCKNVRTSYERVCDMFAEPIQYDNAEYPSLQRPLASLCMALAQGADQILYKEYRRRILRPRCVEHHSAG